MTNVRQKLQSVKTDGLYPTIVSSGRQSSGFIFKSHKNRILVVFFTGHFSLGAMGDSFYEYLLKTWLITGKADEEAKEMFYVTLEVYSTAHE